MRPIFKWIAETWLKREGTRIIIPIMATRMTYPIAYKSIEMKDKIRCASTTYSETNIFYFYFITQPNSSSSSDCWSHALTSFLFLEKNQNESLKFSSKFCWICRHKSMAWIKTVVTRGCWQCPSVLAMNECVGNERVCWKWASVLAMNECIDNERVCWQWTSVFGNARVFWQYTSYHSFALSHWIYVTHKWK